MLPAALGCCMSPACMCCSPPRTDRIRQNAVHLRGESVLSRMLRAVADGRALFMPHQISAIYPEVDSIWVMQGMYYGFLKDYILSDPGWLYTWNPKVCSTFASLEVLGQFLRTFWSPGRVQPPLLLIGFQRYVSKSHQAGRAEISGSGSWNN